MVPISISGRTDEITHAQKEHARQKVEKLERYFNGITRIEVILDKHPERCRAELVMSVKKGSSIVVHCDHKDLYAAIDLVLDKAETQLTRHKEKLQDRRNSTPVYQDFSDYQEEDENLESYEDVIESRDFS